MSGPNRPMVISLGSPGSGKTVAAARNVLDFPGSRGVLDPHNDNLAELVLTHVPEGNVLFDRLSEPYPLAYGLLTPSTHPDAVERHKENLLEAQVFAEIMMRRQGGTGESLAASPLKEEWLMAALMLFLSQDPAKDPAILPACFRPGDDAFKALTRDGTQPEIRHKFQQLEKTTPEGLRSEVGLPARLVNAVFGSDAFVRRCRSGFDLGGFLAQKGLLIVERGGAIDDSAMRTIMCGITTRVIEYAKRRPVPHPEVRIYLDECTNAATAGRQEEKAAGETRKNGRTLYFIAQFLDFPGGASGFLQNCVEKHAFRTADAELARKLAMFIEPGLPERRRWSTGTARRRRTRSVPSG